MPRCKAPRHHHSQEGEEDCRQAHSQFDSSSAQIKGGMWAGHDGGSGKRMECHTKRQGHDSARDSSPTRKGHSTTIVKEGQETLCPGKVSTSTATNENPIHKKFTVMSSNFLASPFLVNKTACGWAFFCRAVHKSLAVIGNCSGPIEEILWNHFCHHHDPQWLPPETFRAVLLLLLLLCCCVAFGSPSSFPLRSLGSKRIMVHALAQTKNQRERTTTANNNKTTMNHFWIPPWLVMMMMMTVASSAFQVHLKVGTKQCTCMTTARSFHGHVHRYGYQNAARNC